MVVHLGRGRGRVGVLLCISRGQLAAHHLLPSHFLFILCCYHFPLGGSALAIPGVHSAPWVLVRSVISRAPGLKLVVETLISSLKPIGNIVLICCAFFIIFGILGVQVRGTRVCRGWGCSVARWGRQDSQGRG